MKGEEISGRPPEDSVPQSPDLNQWWLTIPVVTELTILENTPLTGEGSGKEVMLGGGMGYTFSFLSALDLAGLAGG